MRSLVGGSAQEGRGSGGGAVLESTPHIEPHAHALTSDTDAATEAVADIDASGRGADNVGERVSVADEDAVLVRLLLDVVVDVAEGVIVAVNLEPVNDEVRVPVAVAERDAVAVAVAVDDALAEDDDVAVAELERVAVGTGAREGVSVLAAVAEREAVDVAVRVWVPVLVAVADSEADDELEPDAVRVCVTEDDAPELYEAVAVSVSAPEAVLVGVPVGVDHAVDVAVAVAVADAATLSGTVEVADGESVPVALPEPVAVVVSELADGNVLLDGDAGVPTVAVSV